MGCKHTTLPRPEVCTKWTVYLLTPCGDLSQALALMFTEHASRACRGAQEEQKTQSDHERCDSFQRSSKSLEGTVDICGSS
jgi:hypothetical protein